MVILLVQSPCQMRLQQAPKARDVTALCSAQLAAGDVVYLASTGPAQYQYGFQLLGPEQPLAGQEEQVCYASSAKSCLRYQNASVSFMQISATV